MTAAELRALAAELRRAALAAAEPGLAVRRAVSRTADGLGVTETGSELAASAVRLVATGKAAGAMALATSSLCGGALVEGVAVLPHGTTAPPLPPSVRVVAAGHPLPDAGSVAAGRAIEELLARAGAGELVVFALSGGSSALAVAPVAGVELAELRVTTELLQRAGAAIDELNAVRKHLDRLKGGGAAVLAAPADVLALVLSDVVGDDLSVIASGPTVADSTRFADALGVCERRGVLDALPRSVREHLVQGTAGARTETPKPGDPRLGGVVNVVVGSNRLAAEAVIALARSRGLHATLVPAALAGEARVAGAALAARARAVVERREALPLPACLVFGGETTVTVRGTGRGGRNQELALAAALALEGVPGVLVSAFGTDGIDGPTDAAGACADGSTLSRARALGLDAAKHLADNDAYDFFAALGDLIVTGPTGTNVNDLALVLVG